MKKTSSIRSVVLFCNFVLLLCGLAACSKKSTPKPVTPPQTDAKIVGTWQISQNAEVFDTTSSTWNPVTLSDNYTAAIWHFGSGTTSGKYTADHATGNNFNTNDGVWAISSGRATIRNNTNSTTEFDGPITYNADGSFMIECTRAGDLARLTWVKK